MQSVLFVFLLYLHVVVGYWYWSLSRSVRLTHSPRRLDMMSWSDPNWNWGSAVGKAHDVAITTRARLRTMEARKAWIEEIASGGDDVDVEELKMVIALRMQLSSRQGKDGCGVGWNIMCDLAECRYEGAGLALLKEDLQALAEKLPDHLITSVEAPESDTLGYIAACALAGTDFVADGL